MKITIDTEYLTEQDRKILALVLEPTEEPETVRSETVFAVKSETVLARAVRIATRANADGKRDQILEALRTVGANRVSSMTEEQAEQFIQEMT